MQEEFDALWHHPQAIDLASCPFIAQDVQRVIDRNVVEPRDFQQIEDPAFQRVRQRMDAEDSQWQFKPEALDELPAAIQRVQIKNGLLPEYGERFNPMLRCIVLWTRGYLESTINPATGSYYLPRVRVQLFGEDDEEALQLGSYLRDAYQEAEEFSALLQQRVRGAGFFKTLLLRRLGSSMEAGHVAISQPVRQSGCPSISARTSLSVSAPCWCR